MPRIAMNFTDYNREASTVAVNTRTFGSNYEDWDDDMNALANAIAAVSLGLNTKRTWIGDIFHLAAPGAAASSPQAQRERKWLVRFFDNTNRKSGRLEIPAADLSLLATNSEFMNIAAGAGQTLVGQLQAQARTIDGNQLTVVSIEHVGRNL